MSDDLTKHCMCGCIYLEAECPNCNKVTDADRIEELETKLGRAEWLLCDAMVQLRDGKIRTRRNRAGLIEAFLEELKGQNDDTRGQG